MRPDSGGAIKGHTRGRSSNPGHPASRLLVVAEPAAELAGVDPGLLLGCGGLDVTTGRSFVQTKGLGDGG